MRQIIEAIEKVFAAKREHGPSSGQFKSAQKLAFDEINKTLSSGEELVIPASDSGVFNSNIGIKVYKKLGAKPGEPDAFCGFSLVDLSYKAETLPTAGRCLWAKS